MYLLRSAALFLLFFFLIFSLKNLKTKEERKLKRKQNKQSFKEKQVISDEIQQKKEDTAAQTQQKGTDSYILAL